MEKPAWQTCKSCFNNNVKHHILIPAKNNTRNYPLCPHGAIDDDGLRKHFTLHSTELSSATRTRTRNDNTQSCVWTSQIKNASSDCHERVLSCVVACCFPQLKSCFFFFIIVEEYLFSYKCKSAELEGVIPFCPRSLDWCSIIKSNKRVTTIELGLE